jgi:hypothetical protein
VTRGPFICSLSVVRIIILISDFCRLVGAFRALAVALYAPYSSPVSRNETPPCVPITT